VLIDSEGEVADVDSHICCSHPRLDSDEAKLPPTGAEYCGYAVVVAMAVCVVIYISGASNTVLHCLPNFSTLITTGQCMCSGGGVTKVVQASGVDRGLRNRGTRWWV